MLVGQLARGLIGICGENKPTCGVEKMKSILVFLRVTFIAFHPTLISVLAFHNAGVGRIDTLTFAIVAFGFSLSFVLQLRLFLRDELKEFKRTNFG